MTTTDWQPLSVETVADWAELTNLLAVVDATEEFYDATPWPRSCASRASTRGWTPSGPGGTGRWSGSASCG